MLIITQILRRVNEKTREKARENVRKKSIPTELIARLDNKLVQFGVGDVSSWLLLWPPLPVTKKYVPDKITLTL